MAYCFVAVFVISLLILHCRSNHATIEAMEESEMNALIFRSQYMHKKPVIIHSQTANWYSNAQFFDLKHLYVHYAQHAFACGTSTDIARMHRTDTEEITLKLYLKKKKYSQYQIFDPFFIANNVDQIGLKSPRLFAEIGDAQQMNAYTFLLGKIGTGISFQTHGNIWLHQLVGSTKVFLYPPQYSPVGGALDWTAYSSQEWHDYILPHLSENIWNITDNPQQRLIKDMDLQHIVYETNMSSISDVFDAEKQPLFVPYRPLECVLSQGQLLYIPHFWWYSTLNVREQSEHNVSMAMIMQTEHVAKEAGIERRFYHDAMRMFKTGYEYLYGYNNVVGSKQYFEKTLLVDPTFIAAYVALSDIYIQAAQKEPEYFQVVERFMKIAYMLNPDYEVIRESLSRLLRHKGDEEAADKVEKRLPLN